MVLRFLRFVKTLFDPFRNFFLPPKLCSLSRVDSVEIGGVPELGIPDVDECIDIRIYHPLLRLILLVWKEEPLFLSDIHVVIPFDLVEVEYGGGRYDVDLTQDVRDIFRFLSARTLHHYREWSMVVKFIPPISHDSPSKIREVLHVSVERVPCLEGTIDEDRIVVLLF